MQDKTSAFYNKMAPVYPLINVFLKPHRNTLINKVNTYPPGTLLEIGIGTGSHLPLYNKHEITGIDVSPGMLQCADRYKNESVQLLEMNGENLHFADQSFDYVVLSHVIAVTDRPSRMLNEVYRVLKPNGKLFILNHFTPNNGMKYIDKLFHPISKWFHFKSLFYQEDLGTLKRFSVVEEKNMGVLSYFKIIILQKP